MSFLKQLFLLFLAFGFFCTVHSAAVVSCETDSDCPNMLVCKDQQEGRRVCLMKPVTTDFGGRDIACIIIMLVGGALSAAGGAGGGGLFIPTLVLVMGISPPIATPLANAAVFGGAIANFFQNIWLRHPKADRPLIDFWAGMMLEPNTLSGTVLGVLFYVMFPAWLIVVLLIVLLGYTTYRTMLKGVSTWKEESKALKLEKEKRNSAENADRGVETSSVDKNEGSASNLELKVERSNGQQQQGDEGEDRIGNEEVTSPTSDVGGLEKERDDVKLLNSVDSFSVSPEESGVELQDMGSLAQETNEAKQQKQQEAESFVEQEKRVPRKAVYIQCTAWLIMLILELVKGGEGSPSIVGAKRCSPAWWLLTVAVFPLMAFVTLVVGRILLKIHEKKVACGYTFHKGDIHWTSRNIVRIPSMCIIAGILAGLLGIGGGLVKGPIMLELGVLPQVSAATAAYMILFTSSATVLQYLIIGRLPFDYGFLYIVVGMVSSVLGQQSVAYLVKKYKKASIVVFCIGTVLLLSTLMMGVQGVIEALNAAKKSLSSLNFTPLCD